MDTSKYTAPKLPTTQNILDDISGSCAKKTHEEFKLTSFEGILHDSYKCYMNFNALKKDLMHQNELNRKLKDLHKQLLDNIGNMKNEQ